MGKADLGPLRKSALEEIIKAKTTEDLSRVRTVYLGRKGALSELLRTLKDIPLGERRRVGPEALALRKELEEAILARAKEVHASVAPSSRVDLTMPGVKMGIGHIHPLAQVEENAKEIFRSMNFAVVEGPEVETEYYNFDALNIPESHPAREMWDTFWLRQSAQGGLSARPDLQGKSGLGMKSSRLLLRTHTSPMQIRYMERHSPPFQIVVPGRVFRYEATDASHETNFYQLEGLVVGKDVSIANFKFVVEEFFKKFFSTDIRFRYRPSFFPFVEPGFEVDIRLPESRPGASGWLEVMGAGMVHPRVFEYAHYNPRDWRGFAFGMGLDRLAMIKYKVPDIRLFYSGDLRFISQF